MTWETKLGLLVGMGVIILIGILISDHLSQAQRQQQARLERTLPELEQDPLPPPIDPQSRETSTADASPPPSNPLPPAQGQSGSDSGNNATAQASASEPELPKPDTITQDIQPERAYSTATTDEPADPSQSSGANQAANANGDDDQPTLPEGFVRVDGPGRQPGSQGEGSVSNGSSSDSSDNAADESGGDSEPDQLVHHVNKGETLYDIARQYYDNPNYWKSIYEANRSRIPSPGKVRPGVRLVIPNKAGRANTPNGSQPASADAGNGGEGNDARTYKVRRGDSLSGIAERLLGSPTDWRKLYQLNKDRIEDPDSLKPGTVLRVPSRLTGSGSASGQARHDQNAAERPAA